MKRITVIFACVLFSSVYILAQENTEPKLKQNTIKFNIRLLPGIEYERNISDKSGLGISCNFLACVTPYYRFYLKRPISSFYIEANGIAGAPLFGITGLGGGCSVGYKGYLHKKTGIIGEISIGCNVIKVLDSWQGHDTGTIMPLPQFSLVIGKQF